VFPDGRVVVADEGHGRLVFLRPTKSGLDFEEDLKVDGFPSDLCTMGSNLFVLSLQRGTVDHEIDSDGSLLQSFGEPIPTPFRLSGRWARMLDSYSASGRILCGTEDSMPRVVVLLARFVR
jgi:hypothetical protein